MIPTDFHRLAVRFCDEDSMTRNLEDEGALEYRLFLSRFLAWVGKEELRARMFTAKDRGDMLQFEKRKEK